MKKIAIVTTHPIQYNAPWFKMLNDGEISIKVFYTWSQAKAPQFDAGFGKVISWDIPLTTGYDFEFVENLAKNPGLHHFNGIINPTLIASIYRFKPDVLLVFGWNYYSHLKCIRHFKGKLPIWFRGDSTLLDEKGGLKIALRRLILRWVYSKVDIVLYVGEANKQYFLKHGLTDKQLYKVPHAIDNIRFGDKGGNYSTRALERRNSLGYTADNFVVLFAGKLEYKKNPFYLIRLSEILTDSNYRFLFVGNGILENELKLAAANDKRISFLPFQNQDEMPVIYRMADTFILPSSGPGETWGLAVNEAMASGIPILVSTKAGCSYDLVSDSCGVKFDVDDTMVCETFIKKLKEDSDYFHSQKEKVKIVISFFSFDIIINRLKELLHKVNE